MKGKQLKSFSGTVLIMILTVMLVLIIMLMATLTVVTTASQRIYTKYEENQAYYSARSALDVFTQNLLYDKSYYAYTDGGSIKTHTYGDGETADMKQGLALQLELYKIKTKDTADADVATSIQNLLQDEFTSYADDASVTGKDEYKTNFGVVKTGSTYESAIVYEVEFPTLTNGTGGDGSGAHNFGELADKRKAKITVEIMSREYDMSDDVLTSGADAGMKVKDKIASFNGNEAQIKTFLSTPQNYEDVVKAVANGNRKKDKIRLKITAITKIRGVEGKAVLVCNSNEPPVNNSSRAITAFGGTGSDNMSILGGMSAENTINWGSNDGFIYGPVYVEEDFLMTSNGPKIYLGSGENLVVGGDMQLANSGHFEVKNNSADPTVVDNEKAPFVFVGGELRIVSDIDNPFNNVDVIAKEFNVGAKVTLDSSNTIYCSKFTSNGGSNTYYNGDIYVDGDVIIYNDNETKVTWSGDPAAPTVVHGGTGTIHFTGSVIEGSSGTDVTSGAVVGFIQESTSFWGNIPDLDDITNPLPDTAEGDDGTKIEVELPDRSAKKQLETHVQNFDNYYKKDDDGNRVTISVDKGDGSPAELRPVVKSPQTMADIDTMTDKSKLFTSSDTGITDKLTDLYSGGSEYGISFTRVIDTGGGEVKCIWNETSNSKLRIKGGGTVVLLLDETASWGYSNECMILVDDDTTLKIVGDVDAVGGAGGEWSKTFDKLEVYNQTTYGSYIGLDVGKGADKLKVGNLSGVGIKVPKIYYYFTGSKFSVTNNCLLTGYVYGPDTEIDMHAASTGMPTKGMEYNGATASGTPVCIIGSALVKGAKMPNNTGVAYINPDLEDDGDKGDPIHQWQAYQYTRN